MARHLARRAGRILGLGLLTIGLASLHGTAAAADGHVAEVGWWTRNPLASAPDGGLAVAAAPDGPVSIAAIRFHTGSNAHPPALRVRLSEASTTFGDRAVLRACPTADRWEPAAGGSLAEAPAPDCERASRPVERDRGGAWSVDVASLLGTDGSVVIVPDTQPANLGVGQLSATAFEVTFNAPEIVPAGDGDPRPGGVAAPSVQLGAPAPPETGTPSEASTPSLLGAGIPRSGSFDVPGEAPDAEISPGRRQQPATPATPSPARSPAAAIAAGITAVMSGALAGTGRWALERRKPGMLRL